ncbi:MAG: ABC transporter permease [Acidimicrobiia bacterium]|nr:ABC transporter permease [Acidimicrobiia bacterium]MDH5239093.1 ABC transporter permease [Acidimicrobiia bacterium]
MTALAVGPTHGALVVRSLAMRGMQRILRRPSIILPTIIMPVFFLVAFTGSFSGITNIEGYGTDNVYNWMTPYAILQGVTFAGVGAAGMTGEDMEGGFYDRLLLTPGSRLPLMLGPIGYAMLRALIPITLVLVTAIVLGGADLNGGVLGVIVLYLGALGTAAGFACLGLVAIYTLKSMRALLAIQVPIFALTFLSIGQVPLEFQTGWLRQVSESNPVTPILEMLRQGFLGAVTWDQTWPGIVAVGVLILVFGLPAWFQLRRMAP